MREASALFIWRSGLIIFSGVAPCAGAAGAEGVNVSWRGIPHVKFREKLGRAAYS